MSAATAGKPGGGRLRALLPMLLDIVVPLVLYFLLKKLGVDDFWSLTLAGVGTGIYALFNTIRRGKLDFIGILVLLEIGLTVGLLFLTDDPRLIAIKPSFYTAFTGIYLAFTCFVGRPIVYVAATPIATNGDPVRTQAYELAWLKSREFRTRERLMTALFGVGLVIEAILRIVVVYHYSVAKLDQSFFLSQLPGIVVIVAVLGFFRLQVPAISRIVDGYEAEVTAAAANTPAASTPTASTPIGGSDGNAAAESTAAPSA